VFTHPLLGFCTSLGFSNEIDATSRDNDPTDHTAYRSHQQALEMYAFLLQWFVVAAEKRATKLAKADEQIAGAPKKVRQKLWPLLYTSNAREMTRLLRSTPPLPLDASHLGLVHDEQKGKAAKSTGKKRKDDFNWTDSIPEALGVMAKALRLRTERIWQTAPERDTFIS
jgi:condensin complex subunit 1